MNNQLIIEIRQYANQLVGKCTDYQILFCAFKANKIHRYGTSLEELSEDELEKIVHWLMLESFRMRPIYTPSIWV